MSHIRKRSGANYYKTVTAYRDDWRLMFKNARQFNQEGSWVFNDAEAMSQTFEATYARETANSGLPGTEDEGAMMGGGNGNGMGGGGGGGVIYDEDEYPVRSKSASRKRVMDQDYSDDGGYTD